MIHDRFAIGGDLYWAVYLLPLSFEGDPVKTAIADLLRDAGANYEGQKPAR